jgi:hypothetical protein
VRDIVVVGSTGATNAMPCTDCWGRIPRTAFPLFTPGTGPESPAPLGDAIALMMSLPEGVAVHELVLRPTGQLFP